LLINLYSGSKTATQFLKSVFITVTDKVIFCVHVDMPGSTLLV